MKCYLCHNKDELKVLFKVDSARIVKCMNCSLVFLHPKPSEKELKEHYRKEYFFSKRARDCGYTNYLKDKDNLLKTFRKRKTVIEKYKTSGNILDVGCAAGYFLMVMKKLGWHVYGVDISSYMSNIAKKRFGLKNIYNSKLEKVNFRDIRFDVITFWDTIEHLPDPLKELNIARKILKEDGLLVIETQNINNILYKILGKKWHHFKPKEHLYHFSPKTIKILLEKSGFSIIKRKSSLAGRYVSWGFILEKMQRFSRIIYNIIKKIDFLNDKSFYINPLDEMIIAAKKSDHNI